MTVDQATISHATTIPQTAVIAAASALGAALGLGEAADAGGTWPTNTTVLVAAVHGEGLDGGLLLSVTADAAARIANEPDRMAQAFQQSLDALVSATGLTLHLGEFGTTDAMPTTTAELRDGTGTTAHVGVILDADDQQEAPPAAPSAGAPSATAHDFQPAPLGNSGAVATPSNGPLTLLHDVVMNVTVELGRTTMPIRELLSLQPGMVVELDRAAGAPVDVLVNGRLIACGEVVVIDEEFGIRITDIVANGTPV